MTTQSKETQMDQRNREISQAVSKLAGELGVPQDAPELRLAESIGNTIDEMLDDERARLLPQHAVPLLKSLQQLRTIAASMPAGESRGLSDAELADFMKRLDSEHGTE